MCDFAIVFHASRLRCELPVLLGCKLVDLPTVRALVAEGHSMKIFPGSVYQQPATECKQERCFFTPNLGFIRQAIRHGVPLQPIYIFADICPAPWQRLLVAVKRAFCAVDKQLLLAPGRSVEVGPMDANPSNKHVHEVFHRYCSELLRLFDEHKDAALPPEVAARGLQLVWCGHESEDVLTPGEQGSMPPAAAGEPTVARDQRSTELRSRKKSRL